MKGYTKDQLNKVFQRCNTRLNEDEVAMINAAYDDLVGIDVELYPNKKEEIVRRALLGYDVEKYVYSNLDHNQIEELTVAEGSGVDLFDSAVKYNLDWRSIWSLSFGILNGYEEIRKYIGTDFTGDQIEQFALGLIDGVDISKYEDVRISSEDMHTIREILLLVPGFDFDSNKELEYTDRYAKTMAHLNNVLRLESELPLMDDYLPLINLEPLSLDCVGWAYNKGVDLMEFTKDVKPHLRDEYIMICYTLYRELKSGLGEYDELEIIREIIDYLEKGNIPVDYMRNTANIIAKTLGCIEINNRHLEPLMIAKEKKAYLDSLDGHYLIMY